MVRKILLFTLTLVFTTSCSLYKSQGRRNFENDVPVRVPIAAVFHCPSLVSVNEPDDVIEWQTLKKMYPDLTVHESIDNQTVVLLASTVHPQRTCVSEGLDLAEYQENFTF
jgi:hypothetical protein